MSEFRVYDRCMLTVHSDEARTIKIVGGSTVCALSFLEDGKHLLSGGWDGMIRQWSTEDGTEVKEPIKGNECVWALALSGDRKWIVSGESHLASVWCRNSRKKAVSVHHNTREVGTVDISPDSTKFATGAKEKKVFIWDISTGQRLLGPLEHENGVVAVKFSPDGEYLATATWNRESLRIYNAHTGHLIKTIAVNAHGLNPVAWSADSQRIFASSSNIIKHIYVDTGSFISEWEIPGEINGTQGSLVVPTNGRFIASFVGSSLSLWDPSTCERLGPVFDHPNQRLWSIALSSDNNYLATSGDDGIITLRNLSDVIPVTYLVQRPRNVNGADPTLQIEAFRGVLRTLELRLGAFFCR